MATVLIRKSLIPASINTIVAPLFLLLALIILSALALKVGLSRLSLQSDQLSETSKDENVLKTKEGLLREVQTSVLSQADLTVSAVPPKNPVLAVVSQLKNLSLAGGITLSNMKAGSGSKEQGGLSTVEISFDAEGTFASVLAFIRAISSFSPLTTVEKVSLTQTAGAARATISLRSFWAAFPEKIPSLTEPISALSEEEKKTLSKIQSLIPVPFTQVSPTGPAQRSDPFSF